MNIEAHIIDGSDHFSGGGFDWASYASDPLGVSADLLVSDFIEPPVTASNQGILDGYAEVEGLVGSAFSDILRGDSEVQKRDPKATPATEKDWRTEYLAPVISVATVDGVDGAIRHIATFGSQHTESIITGNEATARRFLAEVDSAIVMHNASTQFADGGEFGLGAEIGISTNRMHARGPVGLVELTTYKNVVRGKGTVRP